MRFLVLVVAACSQVPAPVPVAKPHPIESVTPAPAVDASIVAPPDAPPPDADLAAQRAAAEEAAHAQCLKSSTDDAPVVIPPAKGHGKPTVVLVGAGGVSDRDGKGIPAEGPWNGAPIAHKLERQVQTLVPCYAEALKRDPESHGGLVIGANLDVDGKLSGVRVIDDDFKDPAFATCVHDRFARFRIPGGNADSANVDAYFDLAFCTADRGACVIHLEAAPEYSLQLTAAFGIQEARIGACFRAAGHSKVHGVIDGRGELGNIGHIGMWTHEVRPFAGDDRKGTAEQTANDCITNALQVVCIEPPPLDRKPGFKVRVWFQR